MLEKSKLKKKSKYLKKPLQLKNTVSESLAHNLHLQSIVKKETSSKPSSKLKLNTLEKGIKLQHLYHQVELQQKTDSDSDNSEQMLLLDLEKQEEDDYENKKGNHDKKTMLFSHLIKNNGKLGRKLSVLEEKVNQKIQKCSVEAKFKELTNKRASQHQQENKSLFPKALQRSVARMSEESITQVRLSNMQLTHLSLVRVKQQLSQSGKLRVLDLSYNGLTNKSIPLLADILSQNVIQELSLKWNQLTYEGVLELIQTVTYNINLASLDLSYNKLTNKSTAFIDGFLKLFTENKYLTHLNLQFCHLSQEQCAVFAKAYNLINESILCLHFKGNSHYYVNKLGYITKDTAYQEVPNISPDHQFRMGKTQFSPKYCSKYLIGEDCCWLCQRWVGEMFKFPQQVLPSGLIIPDDIQYFIHLSCYDYQPIKLSIQECINSVQKRNDCKKLEWINYEVHLAQIPIPCSRDIKYFFTLNGRSLINQNQPSIEVNEIINFEIFDIFGQIYAERAQTEKYSVFVRRINTRCKEQFGYNKQKKIQVDICHQNVKESFHLQNKKALRTILSKDKMSSVHLAMNFEPLPKISKTKPNTPIKSIPPSPSKYQQNNFNMIVNIRKCKEKLPPTTSSEKYLNLGITPRNKQFLFNYSYLANNGLTHQDVVSRRLQFKQVETHYFGQFKDTYIAKFLKMRQLAPHEDQFMDKFKILTRKYFNSNQLLFSDTFNFIYQTFISINSAAAEKEGKQLDRKNKSVKFVSPAPKDTKINLNINSEKNLEGKITQIPIGGITQQKAVQRHALSMNCISDKYQLTKIKAMPGGSIHTLHSNAASTNKTIKSIKDIPNEVATLIQLNLDNIPTPLDQSEDILINYTTLVTRYARERRVIFELINGFERNCDKEKLKELNQIIQTYNYYKLTLFYEQNVQHSLESLFNISSFQSLSKYITNPLSIFFSMKRSSIVNRCLQDGANQLPELQAMQKQVQSQSLEDAFQSFSTYLNNNQHRIKVIKRAECMTIKSSKKRKGKYGRSLKNIKQEFLGEQSKVVLPPDSDKFLLQIEQEEIKRQYNELVHDLNVISEIFLQVLEQLITKYLTNHSCGEEKGIIQQWLRSHLTCRISSFISNLLAQYRVPRQMARVKQRSAQICEHFSLNSIMQLTRISMMLGSSILQQNLKEYQFISPFHSYQFIIGIEITKLTHITRAIQENPSIVQQYLSDVLRLLSEIWKKYELGSVQKEKGRKKTEATRKIKKIKTINESIERGLIGQDQNEQ